VGIKSIEHAIIDKAFEEGWVKPQPPAHKTGKKSQWWAPGRRGSPALSSSRAPGTRSRYSKKERPIGGLLRYGIPDFKMERS